MIRSLTRWLIRHTCMRCGGFTITGKHWHPACERNFMEAAK